MAAHGVISVDLPAPYSPLEDNFDMSGIAAETVRISQWSSLQDALKQPLRQTEVETQLVFEREMAVRRAPDFFNATAVIKPYSLMARRDLFMPAMTSATYEIDLERSNFGQTRSPSPRHDQDADGGFPWSEFIQLD